MREKPIIFSAPIIKAILENRCTMTRRVIKLQPHSYQKIVKEHDDYWSFGASEYDQSAHCVRCPYGQVGDRLWVRETWGRYIEIPSTIIYKATTDLPVVEKWQSPRFMFKWMTRIWLEITEVRVERLQEITAGNALEEGIRGKGMAYDWVQDEGHIEEGRNFSGLPSQGYAERWYIRQFASLWDSLNAKRGYSWETNPFVWVICFKVLRSQITKGPPLTIPS